MRFALSVSVPTPVPYHLFAASVAPASLRHGPRAAQQPPDVDVAEVDPDRPVDQ